MRLSRLRRCRGRRRIQWCADDAIRGTRRGGELVPGIQKARLEGCAHDTGKDERLDGPRDERDGESDEGE